MCLTWWATKVGRLLIGSSHDSAPHRAGLWGCHSIHSLLAARGPAGRENHHRMSGRTPTALPDNCWASRSGRCCHLFLTGAGCWRERTALGIHRCDYFASPPGGIGTASSHEWSTHYPFGSRVATDFPHLLPLHVGRPLLMLPALNCSETMLRSLRTRGLNRPPIRTSDRACPVARRRVGRRRCGLGCLRRGQWIVLADVQCARTGNGERDVANRPGAHQPAETTDWPMSGRSVHSSVGARPARTTWWVIGRRSRGERDGQCPTGCCGNGAGRALPVAL